MLIQKCKRAGRIMAIRNMGKAAFFVIQDKVENSSLHQERCYW